MANNVIANYLDCSTAGVRSLDLQLISQIMRIAPGALTSFAHLPNITCGAGVHPFLQASAVKALEKVIAVRPGVKLEINSAYRTLPQQGVLYAQYKARRCGITAAAVPGASNHNTGLALDINDAQGWRPYFERFEWDWLGSWDPMHFDFEGTGTKDLRWLSIKAFQQLYNFNHPKQKIAEDGRWGKSTEMALMGTSSGGFSEVPGGDAAIAIVADMYQYPPNSSLRIGMTGDAVKKLQQALLAQGAKLTVDGNFGQGTVDAVKSFQYKQGLVADGVIGMGTKAVLKIG